MQTQIRNKSAEEQIAKFGFTLAEVNQLGIASLNQFNVMFGHNIMNYTLRDMKKLYREAINNPSKYRAFAEWLKPRFDLFVLFELPLRIYVGGDKQFIQRGDPQLEKSLQKVSAIMNEYINDGYITPNRISTLFYYINLIA